MAQSATSRVFLRTGELFALFAACLAVLALGGCGGIEFQGKVFDYAGLTGSGQKADPRMTERAPLLIPPDTHRLPQPGSPPIARADWPVDTDVARKQVVAAKQDATAKQEAVNDPVNPYAGKPSLLDKLLNKSKKDEEETVDVPEPDASDKAPQDRTRQAAAAPPTPKNINDTLPPAETEDPFHPSAPDSYKGMSRPSGNNASY